MELPLESILHTVLLGLLVCLVVYPYGVKYLKFSNSNSSESSHTAWLKTGILAAVIYSMGILVEFYSDRFWPYYSAESRNHAYDSVFKGTNPTIYISEAGLNVILNNNNKKPSSYEKLQVFYRAKNTSFTNANYFKELRELEKRVRFISGVIIISSIWCVLVLLSIFIKTISPGFCVESRKGKLLTAIIAVAVVAVMLDALRHEANMYTYRVYGYYIDSKIFKDDINSANNSLNQIGAKNAPPG